jgi:biotin carboxyl carrier protein
VGDIIAPGQTVGIVEAMKVMNNIESEIAGRVVEVLVQNGQAVEYGTELMLVDTSEALGNE